MLPDYLARFGDDVAWQGGKVRVWSVKGRPEVDRLGFHVRLLPPEVTRTRGEHTQKAAEAFADSDEADPHTVLLVACMHSPPARQISHGVLGGKVAEREQRSLEGRER